MAVVFSWRCDLKGKSRKEEELGGGERGSGGKGARGERSQGEDEGEWGGNMKKCIGGRGGEGGGAELREEGKEDEEEDDEWGGGGREDRDDEARQLGRTGHSVDSCNSFHLLPLLYPPPLLPPPQPPHFPPHPKALTAACKTRPNFAHMRISS